VLEMANPEREVAPRRGDVRGRISLSDSSALPTRAEIRNTLIFPRNRKVCAFQFGTSKRTVRSPTSPRWRARTYFPVW